MTTIERLKELEDLKKEIRTLNRELVITFTILSVCVGTASFALWMYFTN